MTISHLENKLSNISTRQHESETIGAIVDFILDMMQYFYVDTLRDLTRSKARQWQHFLYRKNRPIIAEFYKPPESSAYSAVLYINTDHIFSYR